MSEENLLIEKKLLAIAALDPEKSALLAVQNLITPHIDSSELLQLHANNIEAIQGGNLDHIQRHLYSQAVALGALFDRMLYKTSTASHPQQVQVFGQLALKAQTQCRATLTALVELNKPQ